MLSYLRMRIIELVLVLGVIVHSSAIWYSYNGWPFVLCCSSTKTKPSINLKRHVNFKPTKSNHQSNLRSSAPEQMTTELTVLSSEKRSEPRRNCKTQKHAIADSWVDHRGKGGGASNPAKDPWRFTRSGGCPGKVARTAVRMIEPFFLSAAALAFHARSAFMPDRLCAPLAAVPWPAGTLMARTAVLHMRSWPQSAHGTWKQKLAAKLIYSASPSTIIIRHTKQLKQRISWFQADEPWRSHDNDT